MGVQSRASFKHLKKSLTDSAKFEFQRRCFELLSFGWPDLRYAANLGLHDRRGVDIFTFAAPSRSAATAYDLVVQCKGVEDQRFGRDDLNKAIEDIAKFQTSRTTANEYWLVFNRHIESSDWRDELAQALAALCKSGRVRQAQWLNPDDLLRELFTKLAFDVRQRLSRTNAAQLQRYNDVMREHILYVSDVPFRLSTRFDGDGGIEWDDTSGSGRNPSRALVDSLPRIAPREVSVWSGKGPRRLRLVVSEFGFGKTLLLFEIAQRLAEDGRTVLYQPVAELNADSFTNEHTFVRGLYELLWPDDDIPLKGGDYPPLTAFREILRYDPHTVLVLDGLDEHGALYTFDGLRRVFSSLRDLSCDLVISIRSEFYASFQGNLQRAMAGIAADRTMLTLDEWDGGAILEFLRAFGDHPNIDAVRDAARRDALEDFCGDIPRRPLFLELLVADLIADPNCTKDLASLYRRCLTRKMQRDLQVPFEPGVQGGRPPVRQDLDEYAWRGRIVELLERVAANTLSVVPGVDELVLRQEVTEDEVLQEAASVRLDTPELSRVLQHSILVPSGSRGRRGTLRLRFAHRSFQEFLAASFVAECEGASALYRQPPLPQGVRRFVEHILRFKSTS